VVVVPTVCAREGVHYLSCWATSFEELGLPASTAVSKFASEISESATESFTDAAATTVTAAFGSVGSLAGVLGFLALLFGTL
jgi:hypothetical protein